MEAKLCPECGSQRIFLNKEKGEQICKECGFVLDETMMDFGRDWTNFEDSNSSPRAGAPITFTNPEITTSIKKHDLYGLKDRNKYFRLMRWQNRAFNSIEQNLKIALNDVKKVINALHLPNYIEEETARIYTLALRKNLVNGRSIEKLIAGAVLIACKQNELPTTMDEVAEAAEMTVKEVGRNYRFLVKNLEISIKPLDPNSFLDKIAGKLGLSAKTHTKAAKYVKKVQDKGLTSGKSPNAIAAACLYIASLMNKEKVTQLETANAARITEVTLRNRYREFSDALGI